VPHTNARSRASPPGRCATLERHHSRDITVTSTGEDIDRPHRLSAHGIWAGEWPDSRTVTLAGKGSVRRGWARSANGPLTAELDGSTGRQWQTKGDDDGDRPQVTPQGQQVTPPNRPVPVIRCPLLGVAAVRQASPDEISGARSTVIALAWVAEAAASHGLDHPFDHPDDPTGSFWIRLDRRGTQREQARSVWSRPDRRGAPGYGSGGRGPPSRRGRRPSPARTAPTTRRWAATSGRGAPRPRMPAGWAAGSA
jgi:hypothetical protein